MMETLCPLGVIRGNSKLPEKEIEENAKFWFYSYNECHVNMQRMCVIYTQGTLHILNVTLTGCKNSIFL